MRLPSYAFVLLAATLGLLLAPPLVAVADPPADDVASEIDRLVGGDKLRALTDAVVRRQRSLTSLEARFVQHKQSALLLEPSRAEGRFTFLAPDRVRWDYEGPESMVVVLADDVMTTYTPETHRAEQVKIGSRHRRFVRVMAGTQPLDELTSQFRVTLSDPGPPAPYRLVLTPSHSMLKKRLRAVTLEVDRSLLLPVVVQYEQVDGELTRYEFSALELDTGIDPSRFELDLAGDVAVETIDLSGANGS